MESLSSLPPGKPEKASQALRTYRDHSAGPAPAVDSIYYGADPKEKVEVGSLVEYWRILRRRKGAVVLIAFAGALTGLAVTLPQTPVYQARTSIEIVGVNDEFMNIKQVTPVTQTGSGWDTSDMQTQVRILQSQALLERVLDKLQKDKVATPAAASRVSVWLRALNLEKKPAPNEQETVRKSAFQGLKIRSVGQTRIIEIAADSTDPGDAAKFVNTLANEFIEQSLEARWKTTEHTSQWLTRQLDEMRIKLERSEDELQSYAHQAGLMFTMEKNSVSEEKLGQLQGSLTTAQAERIAKQSRYEMAIASPPEALPDVLNDAALRDYQSKLTELRRQIAELTSTYTAEHSRVKRVQAQLATLESALIRERADIIKRIGNEYEEAKRKEALLSKAYSGQVQQVTGESEKAIKYNILKRELDSNRQLYDTMLGQLKQATIAAAMRASNIRVVDPAKVPRQPYKPNPVTNSMLGLIAGIVMGIAFVIMRERADRTIQQPGDAPFYLNVPELGVVPSELVEVTRRRTPAAAATIAPGLKLNGATGNGNGNGSLATAVRSRVELVAWQQKPSVMAESFRSLLISILFSAENGERPKVMVLTSAGPAEGKSTVVSNLGIAIAEIGQKVLLIDADLRKPRLHDVFDLSNDRGLSDVLRERRMTNGGRSLDGLIRETEIPGLFVLTSGPSTSASTNLLYSSSMPELVKQLRAEFDTILIDTPPMLQIPDARVVGRIADKIILVVRSGKTSRDAAIAAVQRFSEDGAPILGTVLNDWNPKSSPDGYYGYQNGYYGYSSHYSAEKTGNN